MLVAARLAPYRLYWHSEVSLAQGQKTYIFAFMGNLSKGAILNQVKNGDTFETLPA